MDDRLREIEQWVAEARDDLGENGQEAYVQKLYLLDAEIRAAIKDSGILPAAVSPQSQAARVRRDWMPVPALALLALVLVATTVYLRVNGNLDLTADKSSTILTAPLEPAALPVRAEQSSSLAGVDLYLASQGEVRIEFVPAPTLLADAGTAEPMMAEPVMATTRTDQPERPSGQPVRNSEPVRNETMRSEPAPGIFLASGTRPAATEPWAGLDNGGANSVVLETGGLRAEPAAAPAKDTAGEATDIAATAGAKRLKKGGTDGQSDPEEKAESGAARHDSDRIELALDPKALADVMETEMMSGLKR